MILYVPLILALHGWVWRRDAHNPGLPQRPSFVIQSFPPVTQKRREKNVRADSSERGECAIFGMVRFGRTPDPEYADEPRGFVS